MQPKIVEMAKTLIISTGDSRKSTNWTPKAVSWDQLCERLRHPVVTQETLAEFSEMSRDERSRIKDVGGFVGGQVDGIRKASNVTQRQLLALDADFGTLELWDTWEMMVGCAAALHSTHSHTSETPRLRLLIPLSRPVSADEYTPIARMVASWLGIEAFDDTTYEPNRLMYWPSCPSDGEYIFRSLDGEWLDPDDVLAQYTDWRDMRSWPRSERQQRIIKRMGERQGNPVEKPGVIGAFNRVYTITDAIGKYLPEVYQPCGEGRWTYTKGSTIGGAVTYDNDTFLYSHHDTDPVSGRLCSAYDLVRLHLFGEQDEGLEIDSLSELPSTQSMRELCAQDELVRQELSNSMKRDPSEVFEAQDTLQRFLDDLTEQGAAVTFVDRYGEDLRYCGAFGWMCWDGQRWVLNAEPEASMLAMQFADDVYGQARVQLMSAADEAASKRAKREMQLATRLRSAAGKKGLLTLTQAIVNDPDADRYDADPWILNTPDGIIDLRDGSVRPHDRRARCTKLTSVGMSDVGMEKWLAFIDHITAGDVDFARYLQMLAGMAAIGEVYEEGLVISYGPGGNGKSTLFGALRRVLGDYARGVNADVLVAQGAGRTDQSYVAALRGARLAILGETEEGARFGVAQMKRLTSRDVISARALYKDPIEFTPTHTTIMHTNHLPKLSSLDGGTKRRIAVAPFPATLPPERVITNYERVLVTECGGAILKWIVDGSIAFYKAGCKLPKPDCVARATEEYLANEDWMAQFLEECCSVGTGKYVQASALMSAYKAWCELNGIYRRSQREVAHELESRKMSKVKRREGIVWTGLCLLGDDAEGEV